MSQVGRRQFTPDDIIHPVRSHPSGLHGVRDATKPSSLSEKRISTVADVEEGLDDKTSGPQDRDIRKRQVDIHHHGEFCIVDTLNLSQEFGGWVLFWYDRRRRICDRPWRQLTYAGLRTSLSGSSTVTSVPARSMCTPRPFPIIRLTMIYSEHCP